MGPITGTLNASFPDVNFLKYVVTKVFSFSVVAVKTLDILQNSVSTYLRRGKTFSDSIITNFILILTVK